METTTSRKRILILGRPKSGKISLVKALTSSLPPGLIHESTPHAGLTHSIILTTRYYSTEAGIWIDEIPEDSETWLEEYLSEDAIPVLQSLAAIILTVDLSGLAHDKELGMLKKLSERGDELEWDAAALVVGKESHDRAVSDMSSICDDHALEFIDMNESGQNEYGGTALRYLTNPEKRGLARVLEILHTCDWTSPEIGDDDSGRSLEDGELEFELNAFDDNKEHGSEQDVEYLERMMAMLVSARGIKL